MDDDDRPVGRILSRREILALLGGSSVAFLAACTVPAIRSGGRDFTSQLFFDETINDAVFAQAPYVRTGQRLRNDGDSIYRSGGTKLLLKPTRDANGYTAQFDIGLA